MRVIKREQSEIAIEPAHGGSGSRKVYAGPDHIKSSYFDAMTHGYLPAGKKFEWHNHEGIEEIMVVIKGSGKVKDEDGEYDYSAGDVFVFPAGVEHEVTNPTKEENEMIFVRIKL